MAENNLTHQIGLTRTNCAWIALNLLLNILMCYFVLQTRPRPNQTNMNPYYGPSNVWDLPRDYDYDKVLDCFVPSCNCAVGDPLTLEDTMRSLGCKFTVSAEYSKSPMKRSISTTGAAAKEASKVMKHTTC